MHTKYNFIYVYYRDCNYNWSIIERELSKRKKHVYVFPSNRPTPFYDEPGTHLSVKDHSMFKRHLFVIEIFA